MCTRRLLATAIVSTTAIRRCSVRRLEIFAAVPGNKVSVLNDDDTGEARSISFQTAEQRQLAELFMEVLCIDATHTTNRLDYQLLLQWTVTDAFGAGRCVQWSLHDNN